jgi:hypothetical protein
VIACASEGPSTARSEGEDGGGGVRSGLGGACGGAVCADLDILGWCLRILAGIGSVVKPGRGVWAAVLGGFGRNWDGRRPGIRETMRPGIRGLKTTENQPQPRLSGGRKRWGPRFAAFFRV